MAKAKSMKCEQCKKKIGKRAYNAKGYMVKCCSIDCVARLYCPPIEIEIITT